MKYVQKGAEPLEFSGWKALANDDWQPTYGNLSGDTKKAVKDVMMKEQGYLCCYCERRIDDDDSHIEHFRPQSNSDIDALDFSNLLCSCQNQLKKGVPRHCGNLKEDWFDASLLVSPLVPDCESRFAFTGDGAIKPSLSIDTAAIETIKRLGLAIPKLNALRAYAIEPFLEETLSEDDIRRFVTGYLEKDGNGLYGEFWTTIRYLFGDYASA
jgi:uncharacterized protein (TIGR02646 family)